MPKQNNTCQLQLRFGWWMLVGFVTLGIVLEALHGFKVAFYLSPNNETRRLLIRLGHAHGTVLALVNIAFATGLATIWQVQANPRGQGLLLNWPLHVSRWLMAATILVPCGFLGAGLFTHYGEPGRMLLLVPVGAFLLLLAVLLTAICQRRRASG